jgi:hypothetical protein
MSFSHLATVGQLSYNGYEFDGSSEITVKVEFVQDDAQRTVLYNRHTITVHFFVNDNGGLDGELLNLRARLSKQGQALRFTGHGFGDDLIVNVGGGLRDVKWGPIPQEIMWTPVGGTQTCEVIWQVVTCVPVCNTAGIHRTSGVMAMNYSASFTIDKGFTTRTIEGYLEIAQTRLAGAVPDSADNYRNLISPVVPLGFERNTSWEISLDKSRVNFRITDRQIESRNPYPKGVVKISGNHTVRWTRGGRNAARQLNRLSMDIELAHGVAPQVAWSIFGTILRNRSAVSGPRVFLESIGASEELFGMGQSFEAEWRVVTTAVTHANNIGSTDPPLVNPALFNFALSGLWQPIGTNWNLWRTSMSHVFDNRGQRGMKLLPGNDAIVDLCSTDSSIPFSAETPAPSPPITTIVPTFRNLQPDRRASYLDFQMKIFTQGERPAVRQSSLQEPNQQSLPTSMVGTGHSPVGVPSQGSTSDTIQLGGIGRYTVTLIGHARRVWYPIEKPAVLSIGGRPATEVSSQFMLGDVVSVFGANVYTAWWVITYALDNVPGIIRPQPSLAG